MLLHHLTKESDEHTSKHLIHSQLGALGSCVSTGNDEPRWNGTSELGISELTDHGKNSESDVKMKIPIKKEKFIPCSSYAVRKLQIKKWSDF